MVSLLVEVPRQQLCKESSTWPRTAPTTCLPPVTRTSPWARRLMFCGKASVMATQDFSRLHSQCPVSSAREHSDFLVHLQGESSLSSGAPWTPGHWGKDRLLTVPR